MILPEIDLVKYQENLSLIKILELYNTLIIGSRILPAYLQTAIINESEDNLKELNILKNYFLYIKILIVKIIH